MHHPAACVSTALSTRRLRLQQLQLVEDKHHRRRRTTIMAGSPRAPSLTTCRTRRGPPSKTSSTSPEFAGSLRARNGENIDPSPRLRGSFSVLLPAPPARSLVPLQEVHPRAMSTSRPVEGERPRKRDRPDSKALRAIFGREFPHSSSAFSRGEFPFRMKSEPKLNIRIFRCL